MARCIASSSFLCATTAILMASCLSAVYTICSCSYPNVSCTHVQNLSIFVEFYEWFGFLKEIDCFILQAVDDVKEDSWLGFTQTMGKIMTRENASLVANVNTRMTE